MSPLLQFCILATGKLRGKLICEYRGGDRQDNNISRVEIHCTIHGKNYMTYRDNLDQAASALGILLDMAASTPNRVSLEASLN